MAEFPGGLVEKGRKHVESVGNLRNLALCRVKLGKRRQKTRIRQIVRSQLEAAGR